MNLSYSAAYEDFRAQVRAFLDAAWTAEDRSRHGGNEVLIGRIARPDERVTEFRKQAIEAGYLYRNIPREWGGGEQSFDPLKSAIIREEFKRARAPREMVGQGPSMLVFTLLEHGTLEQKSRFIRDTLLGKLLWCQGYSEPGAGSDLASLRTRAELDGDCWVVNGHKIWTSNADEADWMFALVRTEPEAPKHDGISYMLLDMKTPGITVRPLRQMTGESDFNEVFFDNVRVPRGALVGERGKGWIVSRSTLKYERALIGDTDINRRTLDGMVMLAQAVERGGKPAIQDPVIRGKLMEMECRLAAAEFHSMRLLTMQARGQDAGLPAMVPKLYGTQLTYDIARLAMDIMGDGASLAPGESNAPAMGMFVHAYLWSLGILIAGGTANIQRNIVAERGLGMPRDPAQKR
ncbi:MAG TPA: acyl-CoA dehydrogenase family protein [Candidatus Binatia bacterium]|nr:acyl-CoA dehydrogenase family protein [Candidatus Binatia bacterium]